MRDQDCVRFLQAWLPRLGLRWAGYRKVRGTVRKRMRRRLHDLGLDDLDEYAALLERDPEERARLDSFCRIPISRFYRDRAVFDALGRIVFPALARAAIARGAGTLRCWSSGCASGEEPYTLRILWNEQPHFPGLGIYIIGTDVEPVMLERARAGCYGPGSLQDLPEAWHDRAFERRGGLYCLRPGPRKGVAFARQDIRLEAPEGAFDLILARNTVFTYFEPRLQRDVLSRLDRRLRPNGCLVIGVHELPADRHGFLPMLPSLPIFRRLK